jgi:hypothetical protein
MESLERDISSYGSAAVSRLPRLPWSRDTSQVSYLRQPLCRPPVYGLHGMPLRPLLVIGYDLGRRGMAEDRGTRRVVLHVAGRSWSRNACGRSDSRRGDGTPGWPGSIRGCGVRVVLLAGAVALEAAGARWGPMSSCRTCSAS